MGIRALTVICTGFIISSVSVTCCGALEALENGPASLLISLLRYTLIMIPAAFVLSRIMGAAGVFWAFPVTETLAAAASFIIFRRCTKKLKY